MKAGRDLLISVIAVVVGALAGFFYWQQVGCLNGTCLITSSPVISSLYGGVMGYLAAGIGLDISRPSDR